MRQEQTIRMNPFEREPRELKKRVESAVRRVLKSGYYILGPEVEAFEHEWSEFTSVPHTVGVGNGLDALELGMRALGIGPGDEVITTAMTAFATVLAVHRVGATPVIADIEEDTALLSMESARSLITEKTKAVIFVHLYGRAGNMNEWLEMTNEYGLHLIEDCAQAHGARFQGRHVGSFGAFGAFSFYPTKNLGGVGDGGAVVTKNQDLAEKVRVLRNYGQKNRYESIELGMNSRLDELQAAILREKIKWLPMMNNRRAEVSSRILLNLESVLGIRLLEDLRPGQTHVHHLLVIKVQNRDYFRSMLLARNIESLIHYPIPLHLQQALKRPDVETGFLPVSEEHSSTCLSLPNSPWLRDVEVGRISNGVRQLAESIFRDSAGQ